MSKCSSFSLLKACLECNCHFSYLFIEPQLSPEKPQTFTHTPPSQQSSDILPVVYIHWASSTHLSHDFVFEGKHLCVSCSNGMLADKMKCFGGRPELQLSSWKAGRTVRHWPSLLMWVLFYLGMLTLCWTTDSLTIISMRYFIEYWVTCHLQYKLLLYYLCLSDTQS